MNSMVSITKLFFNANKSEFMPKMFYFQVYELVIVLRNDDILFSIINYVVRKKITETLIFKILTKGKINDISKRIFIKFCPELS